MMNTDDQWQDGVPSPVNPLGLTRAEQKNQEMRRQLDAMPLGAGGFVRADYKQIGGEHYKSKAIQPWAVIESNGMGFFDGNALKYLMRYREKGGVQDLQKAIHYIEKLIEMEQSK